MWEYRVIHLGFDREGQEEQLDALGRDGWELVAVVKDIDELLAYFKRYVELED